ncbi:MAG: hypothetical protein N3E50_03130 [Candidatus Goldbacteria bacterium]|nr:hypothetical protein [Candidatus Goldiibacteriota bacterium]
MQNLIELGVPGLLILFLIVFSQYKVILQNFFFLKTPQSKIFIISLLVSATAFLIHNLVDFDIYNFELAMVFVLIIAALNSNLIIGTLEIKKIKLVYYLGLNPGKRRSLIFAIILLILGLSAINISNNIYIITIINVLIAVGFSILSVSKEEIRRTELDIPIIILILLSIISIFYSPNIYQSLIAISMLLTTVTVFYLYSQFLRRYVYKIIISNYLIIIGIILSFAIIAISILQLNKIQLSIINNIKYNYDIISLYLIIPFNLLLCRILLEKKVDYQNLKISGLILLLCAQLIITSKIIIFLQLLSFIIIWIYYKTNKLNVKDTIQREFFKSKFLKLIMISILIIIVILFSGLNVDFSLNKEKITFSEKFKLFFSSIRMIYDKPLTGHGLGSFSSIFPAYNFPAKGIAQYQNLYNLSGSEFLQIGASLGIPGIIIFLLIIYLIITKIPETGGHRKVWSSSTGAYFSIIIIFISCLFYNSMHHYGLLITFAILTAFLAKEKYSILTIPREALFFVKIFFFVPLIFAFIIFSFFIRPAIGEFLFNSYKKSGNPEYLKHAITLEPLNGKYFFEKGLFFEKIQKYKESIKNYNLACNLDRKNYIYFYHLGRIYTYLEDISSAIKFFEKSIIHNPYNVFAYYELANLYFTKLKNLTEAKKYIIKSIEYEPNFVSSKNLLASILLQEDNKIAALNQYNEIEDILQKYEPKTEYEKSLLDFKIEMLYLNKATILKNIGNSKLAAYYYKKYYELSRHQNIKK